MKHNLTLVCRLQPTPEQTSRIEETLKAFADACTYANETVLPKVTSKRTIQASDLLRPEKHVWIECKSWRLELVPEYRQIERQRKRLKPLSPLRLTYDARIFDYREKDCQVSLTLLNGRETNCIAARELPDRQTEGT